MNKLYPYTFERLTTCMQEVLNHWHDDSQVQEHLGDLRLLQGDNEPERGQVGVAFAVRGLIRDCLSSIEKYAPEKAIALEKRYIDGETLQAIAADLKTSVATAKRRSEDAVQRLAKMLYDREKECRDREIRALRLMLPPQTYDDLFGQDETVEAVLEQLLLPGSPWILALVGIGGIGKSAIADQVVRRALEAFHFDRAIWIRNDQHSSARNPLTITLMVDVMQRRLEESLYGVRRAGVTTEKQLEVWTELKERPYLVVIDNLETEADTLMLMEFLRYASEPTKFLVTARSRLLLNSGIYHYPIRELDYEDSHRLLSEFSQKLGPFQPEVTRPISRQIFERVGGHPLALKLVANLLGVWPVDQILADFSRDGGKSEREIYRPIFLRLWEVLSPPARRLVQAVSQLEPEGARAVDVKRVGRLTDAEFWAAVEELSDRSLVEVRGPMEDRRYGIHRLTQGFMETGLPVEEI